MCIVIIDDLEISEVIYNTSDNIIYNICVLICLCICWINISYYFHYDQIVIIVKNFYTPNMKIKNRAIC